jgi:hypothetical protein
VAAAQPAKVRQSCSATDYYYLYALVVSITSHATKFLNVYTKGFIFLRNVFHENYSPFDQHDDIICN